MREVEYLQFVPKYYNITYCFTPHQGHCCERHFHELVPRCWWQPNSQAHWLCSHIHPTYVPLVVSSTISPCKMGDLFTTLPGHCPFFCLLPSFSGFLLCPQAAYLCTSSSPGLWDQPTLDSWQKPAPSFSFSAWATPWGVTDCWPICKGWGKICIPTGHIS